MNNAPIFIVGVPRSGTTLLAAIISAHSRISCGPETDFFRRMGIVGQQPGGRKRLAALLAPSTWPDKAIDMLLHHPGPSVPEHYGISRTELNKFLAARKPSMSSILGSLTETMMNRNGKSRWAEKTPAHLRYVSEIRIAFPKSPILRIVRDPRDVALSLQKVTWGTKSIVQGACVWREYDRLSRPFFSRDRNCYTVQYERLVQQPELEVRKVCDFLCEEFEPSMLDTSQSAQGLTHAKETWKANVGLPVARRRIGVWQSELSRSLNRSIESLLGDRLRDFGYQSDESFERYAEVYPPHILPKYCETVERLALQGLRLWPASNSERPSVGVLLGDPESDNWFGRTTSERLRGTARAVRTVLGYRLSGAEIRWSASSAVPARRSICSRILSTSVNRVPVIRVPITESEPLSTAIRT